VKLAIEGAARFFLLVLFYTLLLRHF